MTLTAPLAHADELTVADGTTSQDLGPIYSGKTSGFSNGTGYVEILYPKSLLTKSDNDMTGTNITGLTYYSSQFSFSGGAIEVQICETSNPNLNAEISETPTTIATFSNIENYYSNGMLTLDFGANSFTYSGENNLLVRFKVTQKGSKDGRSKYYCNPTYNELGSSTTVIKTTYTVDNGYGNASWLPKTTFTYQPASLEPYAAKVTPNILNFDRLPVGSSRTMNLTLKNIGVNAFTPTVTVTGNGFSTTYEATELASKTSTNIPVLFAPSAEGDYTGTLIISCGNGIEDFEIPLSGSAAYEKTVADGTETSEYLPIYGWNHGYYQQQNQFVYPASMMTSLVGKKLKSITFYPAEVSSGSYYATTYKGINFYNGSVTFKIASVDEGSISFIESGNTPKTPEGLTTVGVIQMESSAQPNLTEWTLTFEGEGFDYYGGDLFVDVTNVKGNDGRTYFYGVTTDNYSGYYCSSSTSKTGSKFLPKATFTFEDAVAQVTVTPTELTFGGENFIIGNTDAKTFKVSNTTDEDVTLTLNDESGFYSIAPTTVEAGATSVIVTVTYAPTAAGSHEATVSVGDKTVTLTGTAVAPVISGTVTPAELTFETYENVAATEAITIENIGNTAFTPVFSGIEAPFSIAEATEIAAGQSKEFTVTYAPTAVGSNNGTLNVTIGEQTPIAVTLTGTAIEAPLVVTVAENGTSNSTHIPITGNFFDNDLDYGQTIYYKNDLGLLAGNNITKVKYYSNDAIQSKLSGIELEIYLMETPLDEIEYNDETYKYVPFEFTGSPNGIYTFTGNEDKELEFALSTPFAYSGENNLVVQLKVKTKGSYQDIPWVGKTSDKTIGYYAYSTSTTGHESFLPKTTFTYEKEEEPAAVEATLAQIEGAEGVVGTKYAITDEYLVAVEKRDVEIDGTGYVYVWCKDDNKANQLAPAEGVIDFMQQQGVQGDWDQSNWVVLRFKGDDQEARSLKNCKLTNVIGTYVDASNYMIDVESYEKGESAEYTPNVYCVANFNAANWGAAGVQQEGKDSDAPYYFFMTPKAQEVCEVTFAEWNGSSFQVPNESGFSGALTLGWAYNQDGAGTPMSQETVNLEEGKSYKFNAIVMRSASKGAINGGSVVYPTNLTGGTENDVPTAISTVGVNGMVESVKYYNVAGVESNEPFEGVNIVVIRYSDGSTTTTKVLK